MTQTDKETEERNIRLVKAVEKACEKAKQMETSEPDYNYWKGYAHGLSHAWDILQGLME